MVFYVELGKKVDTFCNKISLVGLNWSSLNAPAQKPLCCIHFGVVFFFQFAPFLLPLSGVIRNGLLWGAEYKVEHMKVPIPDKMKI